MLTDVTAKTQKVKNEFLMVGELYFIHLKKIYVTENYTYTPKIG